MKKIIFEKKFDENIDKKPIIYPGHTRLISRRDFLKAGIIPVAASIFSNSIFQIFANKANANEKALMTPFLVFDLAGGAALPANFLVGGKGGPEDLLPKYDKIGSVSPKQSNTIDSRFGAPMFSSSGIFRGITSHLSSEAQKYLKFVTLCHSSQFDTSNNKMSLISSINKYGNKPKKISSPIGSGDSTAGGRSQNAFAEDAPAIMVESIEDLKATFASTTSSSVERLSSFNENHINAMLQSGLKNSELEQIQQAFKDLKQIAHQNKDVFDPFKNDKLTELSLLVENNTINLEAVSMIAYNVIQSNVGPGCIHIGSCDYHDNTRQTGDQKDFEIGVNIARAVEIAYRLKKPLFFQIITDGGIYAKEEGGAWLGDTEDSLTVMGIFTPNNSVELSQTQLGHYLPEQVVDQNTLIAGQKDTTRQAAVILANYLSLHNQLGKIEKYFRNLTLEEIDKLVVLHRKT